MKNVFIYPAIFRKEESGYREYIPDLQNATSGENLQEAIYMAKDLIGALAIEYIDYENKEMPKASDINDVELENEGDFVTLIDLDFDEYKNR